MGGMKSLLILALLVLCAFAFFFTRPTKADFETYVRNNTKIVDGTATGGQTVAAKIGEQLRTFAADTANRSAADIFLSECTYDNKFLYTNVTRNGKVIYTGALGHWFERGANKSSAEPAKAT